MPSGTGWICGFPGISRASACLMRVSICGRRSGSRTGNGRQRRYTPPNAFRAAANIWADINTADGYFNHANALAQLKDYKAAADNYELALVMRPDWPEAQTNLELVRVLGKDPDAVDNFEGGTGGMLGADDIVFTNDEKRMAAATEDEQIEGIVDQKQINQLWMRRLQTRPADFLRLKFSYQSMRADLQAEEQP